MGKFQIKIRTLIIAAFLSLSIIIIGIMGAVYYKSTKDLALITTAQAFDNLINKLDREVEPSEFKSKFAASFFKELPQRSGVYIFKIDGSVIAQFDTYLVEETTNINKKYKDIFIEGNKVKNLNSQEMIQIGGKEFLTLAKRFPSKENQEQYILLFSSIDSIMEPYKQKLYKMLQYMTIFILVSLLPLIYLLARFIEKPILELQSQNKKSLEGTSRDIKKVNFFLQELSLLSNSFYENSQIYKQNQDSLELRFQQRTAEIVNFLHASQQGFLFFDSQMVIGKKYSDEAKRIFNIELSGANIIALLYPQSLEKQQAVTQILQDILKDEPQKQMELISHLDKEFIINHKNIAAEYKLLPDHSYMLILTDVTSQKRLNQKLEKDHKIFKMVVEVVTNLEQFLDLKKEYEVFVSGIESFDNLEYLKSLQTSFDRFKESFEQKEMFTIVKKLTQFESDLEQSLIDARVVKKISSLTQDTMLEWLEADVKILKSILGDEFIDGINKVFIDRERIQKIMLDIDKYIEENKKLRGIQHDIDKLTKEHVRVFVEPYKQLLKAFGERIDKYVEPLEIDYDDIYGSKQMQPFTSQVEDILSKLDSHTNENDKFKELYKELEKLSYHNIKVFLEPYRKFVKQLALKNQKEILPLNLKYDELFISDRYKPFLNSLSQLFRNALEHGIENLEKREANNKNRAGKLNCMVKKRADTLTVSLSDDGQGIALETIRETALEKELYSFKELEIMDEKELLMVMFNEKFTSSSKELSINENRGKGLSGVYNELVKLDGSVSIKNTPNLGIEFLFTIPFED